MLPLPYLVILGTLLFIGVVLLFFALREFCACFSSYPEYTAPQEVREGRKDVVINVELQDIEGVNTLNNQIAEFQGRLKDVPKEDKVQIESIISEVQGLLRRFPGLHLREELNDCRLLIGVDATPGTLAGYCVNFTTNSLSYYVVPQKKLPWTLDDPTDTGEFEMRNFRFALAVWKREILAQKRIRIYTDNLAITGLEHFDGSRHGSRALQVLHQYREQGVNVLNMTGMGISKNRDLKGFVQYIKPADDLSRWKISSAVDYLQSVYHIENVQATHFLDNNRKRRPEANAHYTTTSRYNEVLGVAEELAQTMVE